jgi:hypothetical protein
MDCQAFERRVMTMSLKRQTTLREAMTYAGDMEAKTPKPECYRWAAKWWRLYARESKNSGEPMQYAENQMALYRDMLARPAHYTDTLRPTGITDWQWSGLSHKL